MRSGVTLATLRKEVMIEAGFSTEAGHAAFNAERITQIINRTERAMATMADWGNMTWREQVTVLANSKIANLPQQIEFAEIDRADVLWGQTWLPIYHGIGPQHLSVYTDLDRVAPVIRWQVIPPGNKSFEVWPAADIDQTLLFTGSKKLGGMAKDDDVCSLDADVIVLRCAAEILGRDRKDDAAIKLQMAQQLTNSILKGLSVIKGEPINLAGGVAMIPLRGAIGPRSRL